MYKFITNKKFIVLFGCFLSFAVLLISGAFFVKSKIEDTAFLKSFLLKKYNLVLECDDIKGNFSGADFNLKIPEISVLSKDTNVSFLKVNDFFISVKIFPLILGKISIKNFEASNLNINLKREKNGAFDFAKFIKFGGGSSFFKADLSDIKGSVANYSLNFDDYLTDTFFALNGHNVTSNGLNTDKSFVLGTSGTIKINDKTSHYLFDVDYQKDKKTSKLNKQEFLLSNFDTSFLKKYLSKYNVISTESVIDIYSTDNDKKENNLCVYINKINYAFDYKGDRNTIKTDKPVVVDIDFSRSGNHLIIHDGKFITDGVSVEYKGKIKNYLNLSEIEPELKVKISDTYLQKLLVLAPDTLIPFQEPYVKNLKKYNANAIINGSADVNFKNIDDFSVRGKLVFDDVYVVERPKDAKTSFGECEFMGRDVLITVYANAPGDATLTVFGKTRMQKMPFGEFDIKSTGELDLAFAHKVLMPVQKILALKLGPLPYMTLKGSGKINLHTTGTKEKANLDGWFTTENAQVTLDGLNTLLTNGSVRVVFNKDQIEFRGAKGLIEGADAHIDGTADTLGNLNIDVNVKNIQAKKAMNIAQTSPLVTSSLDGGAFLKSFRPESGNLDFYMNLSGNVPPDAVFGEQSDSVFAKGKLTFKGVNLNIEPKIKATNLKGVLNFENNADFDLRADIFDSPFVIKGKVEQKGAKNKVLHGVPSNLEINLTSSNLSSNSTGRFIADNIELFIPENRLFAKNLAQIFMTNKFTLSGNVSANGLVYPNNTELDLSGFDFDGSVKGINKSGSDFNFKDGSIILKNKNAKFDNLKISAAGIDFLMTGNVDKFVSNKPYNNLRLVFYNSSVASYVEILKKLLPNKLSKTFDSIKDIKGNVAGKIKLTGDKIDGEFVPSAVSLFDEKTGQKIVLQDGKIKLKNDKTYLSSFNLKYGNLPLYIDGYAQTDGRQNPVFNIFMSANITEEDCDNLINPYLQYPILISGETSLKGRIQGTPDSYTTYLTVALNEGSDLSFMGLKAGDTDSKREISSKIKFKGNYADINYIKYFKYILSQSNKQSVYELINVAGGVKLNKGSVIFNNLKLHTPNPAPVRFLNLLFKKSLIKDGLFTSNLTLNGSLENIKIDGNLTFSKVFVPVYNSVIDNIKIDLNKNTGRAEFKLVSFGTTGNFIIDFVNKTTLPFVVENISIHSDSVSINNLMKAFTTFASNASNQNSAVVSSGETNVIRPGDITIKKGSLSVDEIDFNGIIANNLKLNFSHTKETSLKIDDAYLSIAGGLIKGGGSYAFDTKDVNIESDFINCDANELTKAFFNLSGQIYGNANGRFTASMKDFTPDDYVKKINANAEFEIINGKLPKLGSIEYLLRASNFFKSGIFGLTINNVIELLTPYKHGDFNKITGNLQVSDAKINDLKIYSQGDNLSTYTFGSYDILAGTGDIEVLGKLSKNISNLLGPIGNASVVSVLNVITRNKMDELVKTEMMKNVNKIPLMNLNNDDYRLFNVKIEGEVKADDIVKSFSWLN